MRFGLGVKAVAPFDQVAQFEIDHQIDLHGRGVAIGVDQQVLVKRAVAHLLLGQADVGVFAFQCSHIARDFGQRHRRTFYQRHIEQADDRIDLFQRRQFVSESGDVGEYFTAEQCVCGLNRSRSGIIGTVALAQRAVVLQVAIILEHQRIGGGIEFELGNLNQEVGDDRQDRDQCCQGCFRTRRS